MHAAEAQVPGVPDHVKESDRACPALRRVHPIACPGILGDVAFAACPNIKPIQGVVENRQPDSEQLQSHNKRKTAEERDLLGIGSGTFSGKRV